LIYLKTKTCKIIIFALTILVVFTISKNMYAIKPYQKVDFTTGVVTGSSLNVRSGPSTSYSVVAKINKGEYIRVFAQVGDWYIIQTDADNIGAVSKSYIKPVYPSGNNVGNTNTNNNVNNNSGINEKEFSTELTSDEKEVFDLINKERQANGLAALKIDDEVQNVARIKAKDMVDNNYFSHDSPVYGSPFNMLKSFKVTYKTAGENIAGNSSNSAAVKAWMNSSGHRANILNNGFNYTGVAVVKSNKYGKMYVQMFIGK